MSEKKSKNKNPPTLFYFWWGYRDCKSPSAPRRRDGPHSLRKVQTAHTLVFTNWRSEPFLGSRPRAIQKLNDRQAVVEFLVGTQGLEPWTQ